MTTHCPNRNTQSCGGRTRNSHTKHAFTPRDQTTIMRNTSEASASGEQPPVAAATPRRHAAVLPRSGIRSPACFISFVKDAVPSRLSVQQASDPARGNDTGSLSPSARKQYTQTPTNPCTSRKCHTDSASLANSQLDRFSPASARVSAGGNPTTAAKSISLPLVGASASVAETSTSHTIYNMYGDGGGDWPSPPNDAALQSLLGIIAPHLLVDDGWRVVPIPFDTSSQLHRKYELRVSSAALGGRVYTGQNMVVLVLAPPSDTRLLVSEKGSVEAEAAVLGWIRDELLAKACSPSKRSKLNSIREHLTCCIAQNGQHDQISDDDLPVYDSLLRTLPTVVKHCSSTQHFGSAYNILSYTRSPASSTSSRGLSMADRRHIHYRSGRLARQLALLSSPSNRFGSAMSVLSPKTATKRRASRVCAYHDGVDSWSLAFHAMLEGVLRDAEDLAVTIPYQKIRWHFGRLRYHLENVTVPRLVALNAIQELDMVMKECRCGARPQSRTNAPFEKSNLHEFGNEPDIETDGNNCDSNYPSAASMLELYDWSNCIFGDPLMATMVSEDASQNFIRGFSGRDIDGKGSGEHTDADGNHDFPSTLGDIVECPERAHVRLLLYKCYHQIVAIAAEFYRPRKDSRARELEARKRLKAVLDDLDAIEDDRVVLPSPSPRGSRSIGGTNASSGGGGGGGG